MFRQKTIVLTKKTIHEKLKESEIAEIESIVNISKVLFFSTSLELLEVIIIKIHQFRKERKMNIHKNRFKVKINKFIDVIILLYSCVLSIELIFSSSISKSIRNQKKKSKIESFSIQWIVNSSQLYKIIKDILLDIYSLQQSLAYRSWRHKNKNILSIDDFSTRSSIWSETLKKTSQKI